MRATRWCTSFDVASENGLFGSKRGKSATRGGVDLEAVPTNVACIRGVLPPQRGFGLDGADKVIRHGDPRLG